MNRKIISGIVITLLLIGTLMLASDIQQARAAFRWNITTVDSAGEVGMYTSIALDSGDKPHISYYDGFPNDYLKYAYYDGVKWVNETVDSAGSVGTDTSIALDSGDKPHISYYDHFPNYDLKYAYYDGVNWNRTMVDGPGTVGYCTSIALDSGDNPHISYCDFTNGDLKYAYYDGVNWVNETVDSADDVGMWTSIALDSGDKPHISYYDNTNKDLKYAYYEFIPDVMIKAWCYTEETDVSVSITMDGSPTGFNTPHNFTFLTGTHTFTVPSTDPQGHAFKRWSTGETGTTITVTSGGTYTAYYEPVHGVNITNVVISHCGHTVNATYKTWIVNVTVTVHNNGTAPINCSVSVYYSNVTTNQIETSKNITNLPPCNSTTLTFNWNCSNLPVGVIYTVKANATCTCGVSDEFVNGQVKIRLWGDVNGKDGVTATDLAIVKSYVTKQMLGYLTHAQALAEEPFTDLNGDCKVTATDVGITKSEVTKAML